jgi:hypothetical protein
VWLLDVNMPRQVLGLLREFDVRAAHAEDRGWGSLTNGSLVEAAVTAGFVCLLTRDRLFGESASRALRRFPQFAVVLIVIRQVRGTEFVARFRDAWRNQPLLPVPGSLIGWPASPDLSELSPGLSDSAE